MIIDASIWVASVIETDAHHAISLAFLRRFVTEQQIAVVPLLAWAEIAGAVARRTGDTARGMKVVSVLAAKTWVRGVPLEAALASTSTDLAARLRLRGADAVYVALAATMHAPLLTLDGEMLARARTEVETYTPKHWLEKR